MPALNFKKQFAPRVEDGTKRQTIRANRKQPIKVGDDLHLFTGMRTKACRRLRPVEKCIQTFPITIKWEGRGANRQIVVLVNGLHMIPSGLDGFAKDDGFYNAGQFLRFFAETYKLPFHGQIIYW